MVDLVKIRKKSRDAKASEQAAAQAEAQPVGAAFEKAVLPPVEPDSVAPLPAAVEPASVETPRGATMKAAGPRSESATTTVTTTAPAVVDQASARPKKAAKALPTDTPSQSLPPEAEAPADADVSVEPVEDYANEDRLSRFKRLAGKRRSWGAVTKTAESAEADAAVATDLELLRFRVAGEDYAVDIEKIVEIVPPRTTTRVPNADESIVGIISLRGTIVTVIDLRRKLGHPGVDFGTLKDARMIVVERAGETAGFLVDRVSRVVKLDRLQLESHPIVSSAEQSEFVSGVFQAQDGLVILLDIERILAG